MLSSRLRSGRDTCSGVDKAGVQQQSDCGEIAAALAGGFVLPCGAIRCQLHPCMGTSGSRSGAACFRFSSAKLRVQTRRRACTWPPAASRASPPMRGPPPRTSDAVVGPDVCSLARKTNAPAAGGRSWLPVPRPPRMLPLPPPTAAALPVCPPGTVPSTRLAACRPSPTHPAQPSALPTYQTLSLAVDILTALAMADVSCGCQHRQPLAAELVPSARPLFPTPRFRMI